MTSVHAYLFMARNPIFVIEVPHKTKQNPPRKLHNTGLLSKKVLPKKTPFRFLNIWIKLRKYFKIVFFTLKKHNLPRTLNVPTKLLKVKSTRLKLKIKIFAALCNSLFTITVPIIRMFPSKKSQYFHFRLKENSSFFCEQREPLFY